MSDPPPHPTPRLPGPGPLSWLLGLALLLWVGQQASSHWAQLPPLPPLRGEPLGASCLLLGLAFALGVQLWRLWLRTLGGDLPYAGAFRLLHRSQLAKYLPGGLWHLLGGVALAQSEGVPPEQAGPAMLLDLLGQAGGAALVVCLCGLLGAQQPAMAAACLVGLMALGLGLHPRALNVALGAVGRLSGRPLPRVAVGPGRMAAMLAWHGLNWALIAGAFVLLVRAFEPEAPQWAVAQAFPLAWLVGLASPFAPAGLGMREASLSLLLTSALPPGLAAALALLARLWFLMGELGAFAVAMAWRRPS